MSLELDLIDAQQKLIDALQAERSSDHNTLLALNADIAAKRDALNADIAAKRDALKAEDAPHDEELQKPVPSK